MGLDGVSDGAEVQSHMDVEKFILNSKEECLNRAKVFDEKRMPNENAYFATLASAYESLRKLVKPEVLSGKQVNHAMIEEMQRAVEQTVSELPDTVTRNPSRPKQFIYNRLGLLAVASYLHLL